MFEFILFIIVFTIITSLSIMIIRLKNINLQLILAIEQSIKDIEYLSANRSNGQVDREHLISFLNETRDIAYKYIEDVHNALLEYKAEIEHDLQNPNDLSIHRFRNAFNKLEQIYPKDFPND